MRRLAFILLSFVVACGSSASTSPEAKANPLVLFRNGYELIAVDKQGKMVLWNENAQSLQELYSGKEGLEAALVLADKQTVLLRKGFEVTLVDVTFQQSQLTLPSSHIVVGGVVKGKTQLVSEDGVIEVWQGTNKIKEIVLKWSSSDPHVDQGLFSSDGTRLLTLDRSSSIAYVWDTNTGDLISVLKSPWIGQTYLRAAALSSNGSWIVTGDAAGKLLEWRWDSSNKNYSATQIGAEGGDGGVQSLSLSLDGREVAAGYQNGMVRIWRNYFFQSLTYGLWRTLPGYQNQIDMLALSVDGKRLIAIGDAQQVRVWDVLPDQKQRWDIPGKVRISANGRQVMMQTKNEVKFWNLQDLIDGNQNPSPKGQLDLSIGTALGSNPSPPPYATLVEADEAVFNHDVNTTQVVLPVRTTVTYAAGNDTSGHPRYTLYRKNFAQLWNVQNPSSPILMGYLPDVVGTVQFVPNSTFLVGPTRTNPNAACMDITFWDSSQRKMTPQGMEIQVAVQISCHPYVGLSLSPDGKKMITYQPNGLVIRPNTNAIEIWDLSDLRHAYVAQTFLAPGVPNLQGVVPFLDVSFVAFAPTSPQFFVLYGQGGSIAYFDQTENAPQQRTAWYLEGDFFQTQLYTRSQINDLSMDAQGRLMLSSGQINGDNIRYGASHPMLQDIQTQHHVATLLPELNTYTDPSNQYTNSIGYHSALSPDGMYVLVSELEQRLTIWKPMLNSQIATWQIPY